MEHVQYAERIRALEAQISNLVALAAAQERLIKGYQEYAEILKEHIATLKRQA